MQPNMKMIQQMQNRLQKAQEELGTSIVEGSAGGGMVHVQVTGLKEVVAVKINPDAVNADDVEMLEETILAAINDAMQNAETLASEKMASVTGGIKIPGLM